MVHQKYRNVADASHVWLERNVLEYVYFRVSVIFYYSGLRKGQCSGFLNYTCWTLIYTWFFFFFFILFSNLHHQSSCLLPSHNIAFTLPSHDTSSQLCSSWTAWTSGPSSGHVPPHSSHPGNPRAAGSLLHACLEPGDHWHLCPDGNGPWYSTFTKCYFRNGFVYKGVPLPGKNGACLPHNVMCAVVALGKSTLPLKFLIDHYVTCCLPFFFSLLQETLVSVLLCMSISGALVPFRPL